VLARVAGAADFRDGSDGVLSALSWEGGAEIDVDAKFN
jgi:hypothetical protein